LRYIGDKCSGKRKKSEKKVPQLPFPQSPVSSWLKLHLQTQNTFRTLKSFQENMRPTRQVQTAPGVHPEVRSRSRSAFTLVELLVILAIIGVLVALLVPTLTKARALAQRAACLSNLRQLSVSWVLYSSDNSGILVESYPGYSAQNPNPSAWVQGNMKIPAEAKNAELIARGQLYPYNDSAAIYRCPADKADQAGGGKSRGGNVRSYSMNAFMGDRSQLPAPINHAFPAASDYVPFFAKETDLTRPSSLWVLIDEDTRTIGDGCFVFDPTGQQSNPDRYPAASNQRHNRGFGLNFADGHSEIWRFAEPSIAVMSASSSKAFTATVNRDFQKLGQVTATLKR
jgi:hypothetical protein